MFSTSRFKLILIALAFVFSCKNGLSQNTNYISYQLSYGKVIPHSDAALKANIVSHQLKWGQILRDARFKSIYRCSLQRGFLFNYTTFNNIFLGNSFTTGYYVNPTFSIGKKCEASLIASCGLGYFTNPYNSTFNPSNFHYSTHLNINPTFGIELGFIVTSKINASGFFQINHFSNGTFKLPNQGLNWYSGGISISYNLNKTKTPYWLPKDTMKQFRPYFEIGTFIAYPSLDFKSNKRYFVNGVMFQYGKRGLLHGWNGGVELIHDLIHDGRGKRDNLKASPLFFSITTGHDFILGKLIFSQQIGVYLYQIHNLYYSPFYHRWGLTYPIFKKISFGLNIKAHLQEANFFDARIVYRINKPSN